MFSAGKKPVAAVLGWKRYGFPVMGWVEAVQIHRTLCDAAASTGRGLESCRHLPVLLVKLKAMATREAAIKRRSPPRKCVLRSLTFRRIESSSCLTPTPLRRTIPVDDKQQTVVSQYTYTKVYERSFMEVLYISAACCNEYLIFKVCVCSLYLHFIFKIDRQTDGRNPHYYIVLLQSSRSAGIIVILAPPPLRV